MTRGGIAWDRWREVGDRVFVRRHESLDVNAGLVLGEERCVVIDTRATEREGRDLLAAVRSMTRLPYAIVVTHAHFDHCFGTSAFTRAQPGCRVYGHRRCRYELAHHGAEQREAMVTWLRASGQESRAAEAAGVTLVPPDELVADEDLRIDLGGRHVLLHHPGRGHTDNDLVAEVPDAGVSFVGDLVEQGAPPSFDDAWPLEWPRTLDALATRLHRAVVPGHGDVVDPDFVTRQRDDIAEVARAALGLPVDADDDTLEHAANRLAVGGPAGFIALRRARAHLGAGTSA